MDKVRIYLREVTMEDSKHIINWRNNPAVLNYCIDQSIITEESFADFYEEKIRTSQYRQYMVEKVGNDSRGGALFSYQIATIFIRYLDEKNKKCEFGILPSPDYEWDDEAKVMAIRMMIKKAFEEFGCHKIYATVFADSFGEIKTLKKGGFVHEAYLEDEILSEDGTYRDLIRLKAMKDEYGKERINSDEVDKT